MAKLRDETVNLSSGQLVVIVLALVAGGFLVTRPEARRRWRDAPPIRRVSVIGLALVAIAVVLLVAGWI